MPYDCGVTRPASKLGLLFGLTSILLPGLAALIFFEILRPFHDNNIDQPIVLVALSLGAVLSALALALRKGAIIFNVLALLLNVAALIVIGLIFWSLSHIKLM